MPALACALVVQAGGLEIVGAEATLREQHRRRGMRRLLLQHDAGMAFGGDIVASSGQCLGVTQA